MAIMVARAAPATSILKTATKSKSSTIFSAQDRNKKIREDLLSPRPLKIPAFIL